MKDRFFKLNFGCMNEKMTVVVKKKYLFLFALGDIVDTPSGRGVVISCQVWGKRDDEIDCLYVVKIEKIAYQFTEREMRRVSSK